MEFGVFDAGLRYTACERICVLAIAWPMMANEYESETLGQKRRGGTMLTHACSGWSYLVIQYTVEPLHTASASVHLFSMYE